jgi:hypothetical protein
MFFSSTFLLSFALVIVVGAVVGAWLFRKDTAQEKRRRGAAQLAGVLSRYGLKRIPEFLLNYSVGDYSGAAKNIMDWVKLFTEGGESEIIKEFDDVFSRVFEVKLMNPEARAYIQSRIDQTKVAASSTAASSPITPTPAPVLTA